jgi:hypothetical protein
MGVAADDSKVNKNIRERLAVPKSFRVFDLGRYVHLQKTECFADFLRPTDLSTVGLCMRVTWHLGRIRTNSGEQRGHSRGMKLWGKAYKTTVDAVIACQSLSPPLPPLANTVRQRSSLLQSPSSLFPTPKPVPLISLVPPLPPLLL